VKSRRRLTGYVVKCFVVINKLHKKLVHKNMKEGDYSKDQEGDGIIV
jgi:hypothetical protein